MPNTPPDAQPLRSWQSPSTAEEMLQKIRNLMSKHNKLSREALKKNYGGIWFSTPRSDQFEGEVLQLIAQAVNQALDAVEVAGPKDAKPPVWWERFAGVNAKRFYAGFNQANEMWREAIAAEREKE